MNVPEPMRRARPPRRNLLEILLDPKNIQMLLAFGGALMVLGLMILLWVNKFLTPPIVAISLGVANAALLGAGWYLLKQTRYQIAGKALTLVACFVMPLNLWYYQANDLIALDGHLWVAALVISGLYAASALVLREEAFVYIFVAGVTMTGLLILADLPPSPQMFWEIASPATMLVVLGLVAIHLERAFPEADGPFSRRRFGLAFFWSGHALLAGGLVLLLGAQIAGDWLFHPIFEPYYEAWRVEPSPIVGELRWLSLALVIAGTYGYIYSDLIVRHRGVFVHVAGATLVWALTIGIQMLDVHLAAEAVLLTFALVGLGLLVASRAITSEEFSGFPLTDTLHRAANTLLSLAFVAAILLGLSRFATGQVAWVLVGLLAASTVISLLACALSCPIGWRRWYVVTALGQLAVTALALTVLSTLTYLQKLEVLSVSVGTLMLIAGHIGWYREQDRANDLVSVSLFLGSLLVGVPLAVATLIDRSRNDFIMLNEVGFLAAGVLLVTTGFICQLKSTTITGAALTALYFVSLLIFVPWSRLNAVAVAITTGGGILFTVGLILGVYRDRLLTLPERIKQREGIFRVLRWR